MRTALVFAALLLAGCATSPHDANVARDFLGNEIGLGVIRYLAK